MRTLMALTCLLTLAACNGGGSGETAGAGTTSDVLTTALHNQVAYIPPQCYTKTTDADGAVHNPCYTCHTAAQAPNYHNDQSLQESYAFPDYALENRWTNLFEERSAAVAAISDAEILAYIRHDNYRDGIGKITVAERLRDLPAAWDYDRDGRWDGFVPDCHFDFDEAGFDRTPDGSYSGWRAFAYTPFPGTFWPTNGATDDVLIRLPETLRQAADGTFDATVYRVNLAIVEALITRRDVPFADLDEHAWGVDLDHDGTIGAADHIAYDWAPLEGRTMSYVGRASELQAAGTLHLAAGLFPEGTEFLHSVRYIDVTDDGAIRLAPRMKELRYARKVRWVSYSDLQDIALAEIKEDHDFPDRLRQVVGDMERGLSNDQGWRYQGFIEDTAGELRPQSREETLFCMGCHSTLGATTDNTFAFRRKLGPEAPQGGWYHWSRSGLDGIPEPRRLDGSYEYTTYLEVNGAGDEFRANGEILERFFNADGGLRADRVEALHDDIGLLLNPSPERALQLNRAYRVIVEAQSFLRGRDATVTPPANVHRQLAADQTTGITTLLSNP